jgi:hypothetical protein
VNFALFAECTTVLLISHGRSNGAVCSSVSRVCAYSFLKYSVVLVSAGFLTIRHFINQTAFEHMGGGCPDQDYGKEGVKASEYPFRGNKSYFKPHSKEKAQVGTENDPKLSSLARIHATSAQELGRRGTRPQVV